MAEVEALAALDSLLKNLQESVAGMLRDEAKLEQIRRESHSRALAEIVVSTESLCASVVEMEQGGGIPEERNVAPRKGSPDQELGVRQGTPMKRGSIHGSNKPLRVETPAPHGQTSKRQKE
jgi:hypothetical protein